MVYPKSGSYLRPNISSQLSTQIIVKVDEVTVGAIQQLQINQNRNMVWEEEIGTDGIIEIHPQGAAKIELSVQRIVFDQLSITEAFARGFMNIQAQRVPFNIQVMDTTAAQEDSRNTLVHTFYNCWFKGQSSVYSASNYLITQTGNIVCEYVTSTVNGLNAPYGGIRGISYVYDSIERTTDATGRKGRLDSAGFVSTR